MQNGTFDLRVRRVCLKAKHTLEKAVCMEQHKGIANGQTVSAVLSLLREARGGGRKIETRGKGNATGECHLLLESPRRYLTRNLAVCNLSRVASHIHADTHRHISEFDEFFSGVSSSAASHPTIKTAESAGH